MKVILGGVRGTNCISQPDCMKYGGDTTSVLVEGAAGGRILIDAGTGVRRLARRLEEAAMPESILLLITHYHLDHLMGLPSLSLLYREDVSLKIASPIRKGRRLAEVLPPLMEQPYWPVQMGQLHCAIEFLDWHEEESVREFRFGGFRVRWCPVHHPGGCTAYRIDDAAGGAVVFATDVELKESTAEERDGLLRLCRTPAVADVLICDGQLSRERYADFAGWGHSAWEDVVDLARDAGIGRLLVTHHSPDNNDAKLDGVESVLRKAAPGATLARDGMEIII